MKAKTKKQQFPPGWNEQRVREVIAYYDQLTEDEWVAEDEACLGDPNLTTMLVPTELVPAIAWLIAKHVDKASNGRVRSAKPAKPRTRKSRKATA